jgi:hypothetical protein
MVERPEASEYATFYAGYISKVPEGDVLEMLGDQESLFRRLPNSCSPDREVYRYADGKWSVREVVGHLIDAERVFGHRAFRIGRGDETPLPGFDEQKYIAGSDYHARPLASLADELAAVRATNLTLFRHLPPAAWTRVGTANTHPVSVRALAFILAGHTNHHLGFLGERYGVNA